MKLVRALLVSILLVSFYGCAWQRIPAAPEYAREAPIPLRVGVVVDGPDAPYTADMVDEFKSMRLFDGLIYPYRDGDPVDAVMKLSSSGTIEASGAGRGFLIGLSLFTLSPFIGPKLELEHDARAVFSVPGRGEVSTYKVHASTESTFGLAANAAEVGKKTAELQKRRLADELAKKIRADRQGLVTSIKQQ
jgi:hypothetical protein